MNSVETLSHFCHCPAGLQLNLTAVNEVFSGFWGHICQKSLDGCRASGSILCPKWGGVFDGALRGDLFHGDGGRTFPDGKDRGLLSGRSEEHTSELQSRGHL